MIVFHADGRGRLRYVSSAWGRVTGAPGASLIGEPATALVRPEDAALLQAELEAVARTGAEQSTARVALAGPQPSRVYRLRVGPGRGGDGVIGLLADVTDRERREAVLRQGERLASLGTLLATAAHELNNPLAAISGFSQLLLASKHPDETREALEMIHHEANRAARTVRDLLDFSRARQAERRSPVDLNAIVMHVAAARRYALETRGVISETILDPELPPVLGERSQLEQVVLALVVNAEQALAPLTDAAREAGGGARPMRLTVRTRSDDGRAVLEVSDTGSGIPPDELAQIWKPFWTTKPVGEGTGLGLAIAHGIVEGHGGSIEVASTEGEGSRFTVTLPAHAESAPGADDDTQSVRPLDVLIVGGTEKLEFLRRYLSTRGHAVLTARTGPRALTLVAQLPVDVVICEVGERPAAALNLARKLRAPGEHPPPRIVFALDDRASATTRERIAEVSGAAMLTTPFELDAVRRAVESA